MNWMIKVTIGMMLFAILFISLGVAIIRANEYRPQINKTAIQKEAKSENLTIKPSKVEKIIDNKIENHSAK